MKREDAGKMPAHPFLERIHLRPWTFDFWTFGSSFSEFQRFRISAFTSRGGTNVGTGRKFPKKVSVPVYPAFACALKTRKMRSFKVQVGSFKGRGGGRRGAKVWIVEGQRSKVEVEEADPFSIHNPQSTICNESAPRGRIALPCRGGPLGQRSLPVKRLLHFLPR